MPLTEATIKGAIRSAIQTATGGKKYDERGLYLLLEPRGTRCGAWWRFKYRFQGKERGLSLGVYPDVKLKQAREKRDDARALLADGVDPSRQRRVQKQSHALTFKLVAEEWLQLQSQSLAQLTLAKARWLFDSHIFPEIGSEPISRITAPLLLAALRKIEAKGAHETAQRAKQKCSQVFRYAIATGRADRDPTQDLRGALAPVVTQNHAAITEPSRVGELLRAIDGYVGQPVTHAALRLAPLVFVRPGELRAAEWAEFDLETAEWRIPGSRMKMGEQLVVPLSTQAVAILRDLHALTGRGRYAFPSLRTTARPMSENTLNAALRRLGYTGDDMTAHGFRTTASTLLNEQGWHPDLIELQLAHAERNKVRAAYNKAQRLDERRKMMQAWADYLDGLRASVNVVLFRRTG